MRHIHGVWFTKIYARVTVNRTCYGLHCMRTFLRKEPTVKKRTGGKINKRMAFGDTPLKLPTRSQKAHTYTYALKHAYGEQWKKKKTDEMKKKNSFSLISFSMYSIWFSIRNEENVPERLSK